MPKAIFVDRDGVLISDKEHLVSMDDVEIIPSSLIAVRELNAMGYLIIGVSNQSVVARNMASLDQVEAINQKIINQYSSSGAVIRKIYFCPHYEAGTVKKFAIKCDCRKPAPGLLFKAAKEYKIRLGESWMVGDQINDVLAGNAAGCHTALLKSSYWQEKELKLKPTITCSDLKDFVNKLKSWSK